MTSIHLILEEVEHLSQEEKKLLLHLLIDKLAIKEDGLPEEPGENWENIFSRYRGMAKGFWNEDAQEYVNKLRDEERL